jgi:adenylate cyclase
MKFIYLITFFIVAYITRIPMGLASINVNNDDLAQEISTELSLATIDDHKVPDNITHLVFYKNPNQTLKLNYNIKNNLFLFTIKNDLLFPVEKFFYLNAINGNLKLYRIDQTGNSYLIGKGGTDTPMTNRILNSSVGAIKFIIEPGEHKFLVSLISRHNISANVYIGTEETHETFEKARQSFLNFYAGGIILLVIYNLFLFLMSKEKVYLYYIFYAFSFMLLALTINGRLDQVLHFDDFSCSHFLICFSSITLLAASLFTCVFLEIKHRMPKVIKFYYLINILAILLFLLGLTEFSESISNYLGITIDLIIFLSLILFNICGFYLFKELKTAKFYLISWLLVLFSVAIWFSMKLGIIPINTFTHNALPIGSMAEMLTLALALAYKINILNLEKIEALEKARDKERYQRLVRVLSHDVANSLTIISAYTKKLLIDQSINEIHKNNIIKINHGAENIANILEIVREQEAFKGNQNLQLTSVNVLHCLEFSKILNEDLLALKSIQINICVPGHVNIKADKTSLINHIFNNIISNAIKFSYPKSSIEVNYTAIDDKTVMISFLDHGVGIPKHLIQQIFFSNEIISSPGTKNETGHGLGSNLIQEYMTLFGGKLEVFSKTEIDDKENHGTLIKLYFSTNA